MKKIIISRTDNLGDVVLTLPVAGLIKRYFPSYKIIFLGKNYTRSLIESCSFVDEFLTYEEVIKRPASEALKADIIVHVFPNKRIASLAKRSGIKIRIGTSHRLFHWFTCNKLISLSRKSSNLHESQLNLKLLSPLGINTSLSLDEIPLLYGINLEKKSFPDLDEKRFNLILHPKSKGSAKDWGLANFKLVIKQLPEELFKIFITGTKEEGEQIRKEMPDFMESQNAVDVTGQFSLSELIEFINSADGLLAGSTGPLHIASALGKYALGLYPSIRPMHAGRWAPIGKNASSVSLDKDCQECKRSNFCSCLRGINALEVVSVIQKWRKK